MKEKESVISPTQEIGDINSVQKGVYLIDWDFLHTAAGTLPCLIRTHPFWLRNIKMSNTADTLRLLYSCFRLAMGFKNQLNLEFMECFSTEQKQSGPKLWLIAIGRTNHWHCVTCHCISWPSKPRDSMLLTVMVHKPKKYFSHSFQHRPVSQEHPLFFQDFQCCKLVQEEGERKILHEWKCLLCHCGEKRGLRRFEQSGVNQERGITTKTLQNM